MPRFTIKDAVVADIDDLIRLETDSFEGDRLSRRSFRRLIAAPTAACRIARVGSAPAAYALLLFRKAAPSARLYSIAVSSGHRGAGLAKALLDDAEHLARRRGRSAVRLEVREDNRAAIALYERRGYRPLGRRVHYYADGSDARVYEKLLPLPHEEDRSPRDSPDLPAYIRRIDMTVRDCRERRLP